jgi:hypothetical protein
LREKHNSRLHELKADLARKVKALLLAQKDIRELRAGGVDEAEIRKVMIASGFAGVNPDDLLAAKTVGDLARLLRPGLN